MFSFELCSCKRYIVIKPKEDTAMLGPITAQRRKRKHENTLTLLVAIQQLFPLAFPPKKASPVYPLNPGIQDELKRGLAIRGMEASEEEIQLVLAHWCSQKFYLKAFENNDFRVDLSGFESCRLGVEEKERAFERKKALLKKRAS
jgi:sRNA-binding protein